MKYASLGAAGIIAALCLSGCDTAKSPQSVADNAAAAQEKAAANVARAKSDAAKDDVTMSTYDLALKKAEGAHDVAVELCNASAGDKQKACREKADADYEAAKANAKAADAR
jgi:hypothetical protein